MVMLLSGCHNSGQADHAAVTAEQTGRATVTITTAGGEQVFHVDVARTAAAQERGLMYRTDIPADGGMLFAPYPPDGGTPKMAAFWMKNTPSALDILFIRPDRTIAKIAENAVPFDQTPISSGEPVSAVLEISGGKSAELGIATGDRVEWSLSKD